jgi:hypothetical protein
MKKQLISASLLALSGLAYGQFLPVGAGSSTNIYRDGQTGFGMNAAPMINKVEIETSTPEDGLMITQTSSGIHGTKGSAALFLNNVTGHKWALFSTGQGNNIGGDHFDIVDYGATPFSNPQNRFFIHGTTGQIGVGTTSPSNKLHISTSTATDDGIHVTQTGSGSGSLYLNNTSTGGKNWALLSTGSGHGLGGGNFGIYDMTTGVDRIFIRSNGNIGIGTTNPTASKLLVQGSPVAIQADAAYYIATASGYIGVSGNGVSNVNTSGWAMGVKGFATGSKENYGGYFSSNGASAGVSSFGVCAEVFNPTLGSTNYGIYSTVGGNGNLGLGPNWAGYFNGDVFTTTGYYPSDRRIKKNIEPIVNSLSIINNLNPVNYNFDVEANPDLNLPGVKQYGFISQEVKEILPELTRLAINPAKYDEKGMEVYPSKEILSLNYDGFIAILAKGMQEQQQIIEAQNKKINALQEQVNSLASSQTGNATEIKQNSGENGFSLDQNIPNPFNQETVISYNLPQQVHSASLVVYDLSGKQIVSFPIEKGGAPITITSEKLAAGIYIYSVMADGKILDSKRMVVADKH